MTEFDGRETARSLVSGQPHRVVARKRIVDATFSDTQIPLTHKRGYSVSEDVACVPINDLAVLSRPWGNYCIIGSGKTGIDACLWLLSRGVDPDRIRWIAPHEAWWFNRAKVQFSEAFFEDTLTFLAEQMEAASEATSAEDLFSRFEALGICFRLDPAVTPAIFRSATVSEAELHQLRRIQDVVRMGRVRSITSDEIELEKGALSATRDCLYIDCSAAGLTLRAGGPIFEPQRITIQYVRAILPCLSAAAIAFIEANFGRRRKEPPLHANAPPARIRTLGTNDARILAKSNALVCTSGPDALDCRMPIGRNRSHDQWCKRRRCGATEHG